MTLLERLIFTKILDDLMAFGISIDNYDGNRKDFADQLIDNLRKLYKHPDLSDADKLQLRNSIRFVNGYSSCGRIFDTLDDRLNKD